MFGTNKLCMKEIYLPTFQRSIILWGTRNNLKIFPGSRLLPAACMELTQEQQRVLKVGEGWP
jgi:hypothetical protein